MGQHQHCGQQKENVVASPVQHRLSAATRIHLPATAAFWPSLCSVADSESECSNNCCPKKHTAYDQQQYPSTHLLVRLQEPG